MSPLTATSFHSVKILSGLASMHRFQTPEIHEYLKKVAQHFDLRPLMKLRHKVVGAAWSQEKGKWVVSVSNLESGESFQDEAHFVLYATGLLSKPKWPSIPGVQMDRLAILTLDPFFT